MRSGTRLDSLPLPWWLDRDSSGSDDTTEGSRGSGARARRAERPLFSAGTSGSRSILDALADTGPSRDPLGPPGLVVHGCLLRLRVYDPRRLDLLYFSLTLEHRRGYQVTLPEGRTLTGTSPRLDRGRFPTQERLRDRRPYTGHYPWSDGVGRWERLPVSTLKERTVECGVRTKTGDSVGIFFRREKKCNDIGRGSGEKSPT